MKKLSILALAVLCVSIAPATVSRADYTLSDNGQHLSLTAPKGASSMTNTYGEIYNYDANGFTASKQTASGYLITYNYDAYGNELGEIEYTNDGRAWGCTLYQYDAMGRKAAEVDASGAILYTYSYNGSDVMKVNPSWSMDCYTYTYDKNGRLTTYKVGDSETYTYTYDKAGNVVSIDCSNPYGGWSKHSYTYDAKGNVTSEIQTDSYGTNICYTYTNIYDAAGRLVGIDDGHGTVYNFSY